MTITDAHDGIESEGDLLVSGGTLTLSTRDDGIAAADTVIIDGGRIDILTAVEGIESKTEVIMNDGYLTISVSDDGINAATSVTVNGGYIYAITSHGDALDSNGTMDINGGLIVALGSEAPEGGSGHGPGSVHDHRRYAGRHGRFEQHADGRHIHASVGTVGKRGCGLDPAHRTGRSRHPHLRSLEDVPEHGVHLSGA